MYNFYTNYTYYGIYNITYIYKNFMFFTAGKKGITLYTKGMHLSICFFYIVALCRIFIWLGSIRVEYHCTTPIWSCYNIGHTVIYGRPVTSIYSYTGYPIKYSLICAARCILFFITIITTNGRRYIFTICGGNTCTGIITNGCHYRITTCCGYNTCTGIIGNGTRYRITTCCGCNTCTGIITNGSRYRITTYYKYTIATYIFILNIPTKPYYIPIQ
ncbi:pI196L [African swine fever virus]|uniref:PI196L n=1 Tax=African swine fever virus TaxID=10497 RepID=A0A894KPQ4_ASF|nr:pI196L [African swine fever virus]